MKRIVILVAAAVVITTSVQAAHTQTTTTTYTTYIITRQGRGATGKEKPKPTYQYYRDRNGNLYDPVTGWPEGNKYGCVNGC